MERIPKKDEDKDKSAGENALRVIRGVLGGEISSKEVADMGISGATTEGVKKVLKENSVVTPAMERDAKLANIKHEKELGEDR